MASERLNVVFLVVMVMAAAVQMQSTDAQKTHTLDWIIPTTPTVYTTFSASKTFTVGDTLVFNFTTGAHTAAQVTKAAYDACTTTNPIAVWTTGPSSVKLNSTGPHYYLCTFPSHCTLGQKVVITVVAATATSAPSPTATTPTEAPAPSSSSTPSADGPGGSTSTPSAQAPGGSPSSAASFVSTALPLTFLSVVMALFY